MFRIQHFRLNTDLDPDPVFFLFFIYFFGGFFSFSFVLYSALLHLPPLGFHCADRCWDSNPGPLQLVHWQSDALTTRLDLIRTRLDLIRIQGFDDQKLKKKNYS